MNSPAGGFGGIYIDTFNVIKIHKLGYTYIAQGNVHPNDAGYGAIVSQLSAVPEPSSIALPALGRLGIVGLGLRRRNRAA